jgi:hypothetical protein
MCHSYIHSWPHMFQKYILGKNVEILWNTDTDINKYIAPYAKFEIYRYDVPVPLIL